MKTIENKTTTISKSEDTQARYGDLFAALLNKPLSKSTDLKSMRRDLRLLDLVESNSDSITVSDEEYEYLASLVENSEWLIKHKDILDFADYIESLKNNKE